MAAHPYAYAACTTGYARLNPAQGPTSQGFQAPGTQIRDGAPPPNHAYGISSPQQAAPTYARHPATTIQRPQTYYNPTDYAPAPAGHGSPYSYSAQPNYGSHFPFAGSAAPYDYFSPRVHFPEPQHVPRLQHAYSAPPPSLPPRPPSVPSRPPSVRPPVPQRPVHSFPSSDHPQSDGRYQRVGQPPAPRLDPHWPPVPPKVAPEDEDLNRALELSRHEYDARRRRTKAEEDEEFARALEESLSLSNSASRSDIPSNAKETSITGSWDDLMPSPVSVDSPVESLVTPTEFSFGHGRRSPKAAFARAPSPSTESGIPSGVDQVLRIRSTTIETSLPERHATKRHHDLHLQPPQARRPTHRSASSTSIVPSPTLQTSRSVADMNRVTSIAGSHRHTHSLAHYDNADLHAHPYASQLLPLPPAIERSQSGSNVAILSSALTLRPASADPYLSSQDATTSGSHSSEYPPETADSYYGDEKQHHLAAGYPDADDYSGESSYADSSPTVDTLSVSNTHGTISPQISSHQHIPKELLSGVAMGFGTPSITDSMDPMEASIPNVIALPWDKHVPFYVRGPSWKNLLRLMARLSGCRIEPSSEAITNAKGELRLRVVVCFVRVHHRSPAWNTVLYMTVDRPVTLNSANAHKYRSGDTCVLPWSYTLASPLPVLRDGADSAMSRFYTIPNTPGNLYPMLPVSFPDLARYLATALVIARNGISESAAFHGLSRLGKIIDHIYPSESIELDEEKAGMRRKLKNFVGLGTKPSRDRNAETYELVTPFVADDFGR